MRKFRNRLIKAKVYTGGIRTGPLEFALEGPLEGGTLPLGALLFVVGAFFAGGVPVPDCPFPLAEDAAFFFFGEGNTPFGAPLIAPATGDWSLPSPLS